MLSFILGLIAGFVVGALVAGYITTSAVQKTNALNKDLRRRLVLTENALADARREP